jgi:hypothetical protein
MKKGPRARLRKRRRTLWPWILGAAGIGLFAVVISQMSGVAYTDADIRVVDFSVLTSSEKRTALEAANRARCTCGCGMTLAQCVATDSTCPLRDQNVQSIRTMVRDAHRP